MKECNKNYDNCAECDEAPCELTPPVFKPCPFCGGRAIEITTCKGIEECENFEECAFGGYYVAVCNFSTGGCGATAPYRRTEAEAIDAWNNRVN